MKRYLIATIGLVSVLFISVSALSQPSQLKPTGFVNDFANIIDDATETKLNNILTVFERQTTIEISAVTVPDLAELPIEDYATTLFEQWGIGKKGEDNGLLLLVAPKERKVRMEVGYGLEGAINDALAGRIIDQTMLPWFQQGDFSSGISNGLVEAIRILNIKYRLGFDIAAAGSGLGIRNYRQIRTGSSSLVGKIFKIILIGAFILLFIKNPWAALFLMMGMGRGGGFRSGGFGGGGFGGFGGGLSGGGGASRGW